ncbi:hypothetical protein LUZ61_019633 [Rhynchospora tenuis]|uniref:FBD domain-containing protein n=1 Tax=Rhynchospora tenuis TaxID=198213 RepID=A0AAD6EN13_9POAL|nr:hypothetical protein LUZ61_019633 [Rhynchospora tenuis]
MSPKYKSGPLNSETKEVDMLSNLPEVVKEKILSLLPIKEAGRTSILSTQWRYKWSSIPELIIKDDLGCDASVDLHRSVDQILFLHHGPIHKFEFRTKKFHNSGTYHRWLLNLSRNGIRELILDLQNNYKIHSGLFSCQALTCLHLCNCTIELPRVFEGFKLLQTVKLENFAASEDAIEKLVSSSPLLEDLFLKDFKECIILNIVAPNLKNLVVEGQFIDIQLSAPGLLNLQVVMDAYPVEDDHIRSNLAKTLGCLPAIEKLEMHGDFVSYLAYEPLLDIFSVKFNHLKEICFSIDLTDLKDAALALLLFQNSPKLEILNVFHYYFEDDSTSGGLDFWEPIERKDCSFEHLQIVTIHDFLPSKPMLSFVRFVLSAAPNLIELTISEENSGVVDQTILKQLLRLKRVSSNAEIIVV